MTRALTLLFATAGGVAVGSLYYAQPLLETIARQLHSGSAMVGLLITATQIGYAVGILLIVPLGDFRERRVLIPLMMLLSAAALVLCGVAPNILTLGLGCAAVGVTTVAGQLLTPLAGDLSEPSTRGRVVGIVVSGLITGILVARIFSGLVAAAGGWRTVFFTGAGLALVLATLLFRSIPRLGPKVTDSSYRSALRSVFSLVAHNRTLQVTMLFGATGFGLFTTFWTALTFLLSAPPYRFSTAIIGLFGIAGVAGAVAAQSAGRLHDRGRAVPAVGLAWLLVLGSWLITGFGAHQVVVLLLGIVVLDVGIQSQNILNQSRIFELSQSARSRLNTAYITGNFVGGAIGSFAATALWSAGGWLAVCLLGAVFSVACLVLWLITRRGALVPKPIPDAQWRAGQVLGSSAGPRSH